MSDNIQKSIDTYLFLSDSLFQLEEFESSLFFAQEGLNRISKSPIVEENDHLNLLIQISSIYVRLGKYKEAQKSALKGLKVLEDNKIDEGSKGRCFYILGTTYYHNGPLDSTLYYYSAAEKAYALVKTDTLIKNKISVYQGLSSYYKRKRIYSKAIGYDSIATKHTYEKYGHKHKKLAAAYNRYGRSYEQLGNLEKAENLYLDALAILQSDTTVKLELANSYENLAYLKYAKADFGGALPFFELVNNIRTKNLGQNHPRAIDALAMLGLAYYQSGNHITADSLYEVSINRYKEVLAPSHRNHRIMKVRMALLHQDMSNSDSAIRLLKEAEQLTLLHDGPKSHFMTYVYTNLATICLNISNYTEAIHYQKKANIIYNNTLEKNNPRISLGLTNLAAIYTKHKEPELALKALNKSSLNLKLHESDSLTYYPYPLEAIKIHKEYCKAYFLKYNKKKEIEALKTIIKHGKKGMHIMASVRSEIEDLDSHIKIRKDADEILQSLLKASILLQDKTAQSELMTTVFNLMQLSKNYDLFLNMKKEGVYENFKDKPLYRRLNKLNSNKSIIYKEFSKSDTDSLGKELGGILLKIHQVTDSISSLYPHLQITFDFNHQDIYSIQKKFLPNQGILNYFKSEESLFCLFLSKEMVVFKELRSLDSIDHLIVNLNKSLTKYFISDAKSRTLYDSLASIYVKNARALYKVLVKPFEPQLSKIKDLEIVTDGSLGLIPFDILLDETPISMIDFKTHSYLLHRFNISYQYYINENNLSSNQNKQNKSSTNLLLFAPSYGTSKNSSTRSATLSPLIYNIQEISGIQKKYRSKSFIGEGASKENFQKFVKDYNIIHLAGHGKANMESGENSFLAFSDHNENYILESNELYDLNLNSDLVVLSACETGLGEMKVGEGIFSLTRGFSYAGSKTIISSLWSINDKNTSILFDKFYQNLSAQKPIAEALSDSKRSYLNQSIRQIDAHPFFWGSFISTGKNTPILLAQKDNHKYFYWIGGIILLTLGLFFYKKVKF